MRACGSQEFEWRWSNVLNKDVAEYSFGPVADPGAALLCRGPAAHASAHAACVLPALRQARGSRRLGLACSGLPALKLPALEDQQAHRALFTGGYMTRPCHLP